jgi:hypothetical protein
MPKMKVRDDTVTTLGMNSRAAIFLTMDNHLIHSQPTGEIILDFSEAQAKIKEDENRRRVEEGLATGLTKEVSFFQLLTCVGG